MLKQIVIDINHIVCKNNLRDCFDDDKIINDSIDYARQKDCKDLEDAIKTCIRPGALVYLLQPFYDGNRRTGLILSYLLFKEKGYNFDIDIAFNDLVNGELTLPLLYDSSEEIEKVSQFYKYFKDIEQSKSINDTFKKI